MDFLTSQTLGNDEKERGKILNNLSFDHSRKPNFRGGFLTQIGLISFDLSSSLFLSLSFGFLGVENWNGMADNGAKAAVFLGLEIPRNSASS